MDDAERLHPLVAAALGQVASLTVQVEYWENIAQPWRLVDGGLVPEGLAQRLSDLRSDLDHRTALARRLEEKLSLTLGPQIETS